MMTKEQMLDCVAKTLGLEDERTIWFFEVAEFLSHDLLVGAFSIIMNLFEDEM